MGRLMGVFQKTGLPLVRWSVTLLGAVALVAHAARAEDPLPAAEAFVDAFYSFEPSQLAPLLRHAGDSRQKILFYQGWAEGGNYVVMDRQPCRHTEAHAVSCSITVQDDLVLALGIDFDVTDTFTLSFEDGEIAAVETSSNDPERYHDARDWTWTNREDLVQAPCKGTPELEPDPHQCVRAMLQGYVEYANEQAFPPREPSR